MHWPFNAVARDALPNLTVSIPHGATWSCGYERLRRAKLGLLNWKLRQFLCLWCLWWRNLRSWNRLLCWQKATRSCHAKTSRTTWQHNYSGQASFFCLRQCRLWLHHRVCAVSDCCLFACASLHLFVQMWFIKLIPTTIRYCNLSLYDNDSTGLDNSSSAYTFASLHCWCLLMITCHLVHSGWTSGHYVRGGAPYSWWQCSYCTCRLTKFAA